MTRRSMATILLLASIIPLNELHKLWETASYNVSPFWFTYKPMNVEWFVKFLCEKIAWCLAGAAFFRAVRWNKELTIAAVVFTIYSVIDLLLFFAWFNQAYYLLTYSSFCFIAVLVMYFKSTPEKKRRKEPQRTEAGTTTIILKSDLAGVQ